MASPVSFNEMQKFYQKIDELQRKSIEHLRAKAKIKSQYHTYTEKNVKPIAIALLKEEYIRFQQQSQAAFEKSEYAPLLEGVFVHRAEQFISPHSALYEEIQKILLKKSFIQER